MFLFRGLVLQLHLLEQSARQPVLKRVLEETRVVLYELVNHTCLLVARGRASTDEAEDSQESLDLFGGLVLVALRLLSYVAAGAEENWGAVATLLAAEGESGGVARVCALTDAVTAVLERSVALGQPSEVVVQALVYVSAVLLEPTTVNELYLRPQLLPLLVKRDCRRALLRLCAAAALCDPSAVAGARAAARGLTLLRALCTTPAPGSRGGRLSCLAACAAEGGEARLLTPLLSQVAALLAAVSAAERPREPEAAVASAALEVASTRTALALLMDEPSGANEALSVSLAVALRDSLAAPPRNYQLRYLVASALPHGAADAMADLIGGARHIRYQNLMPLRLALLLFGRPDGDAAREMFLSPSTAQAVRTNLNALSVTIQMRPPDLNPLCALLEERAAQKTRPAGGAEEGAQPAEAMQS